MPFQWYPRLMRADTSDIFNANFEPSFCKSLQKYSSIFLSFLSRQTSPITQLLPSPKYAFSYGTLGVIWRSLLFQFTLLSICYSCSLSLQRELHVFFAPWSQHVWDAFQLPWLEPCILWPASPTFWIRPTSQISGSWRTREILRFNPFISSTLWFCVSRFMLNGWYCIGLFAKNQRRQNGVWISLVKIGVLYISSIQNTYLKQTDNYRRSRQKIQSSFGMTVNLRSRVTRESIIHFCRIQYSEANTLNFRCLTHEDSTTAQVIPEIK